MLIYIALFACSFFALIISVYSIDIDAYRESLKWHPPSKGISIFLMITGIALYVAWLPDIINSLSAGTTLPLIEVYTTEITYVLDLGIISPFMFLCLYLLTKKKAQGIVILAPLLMLFMIIGFMLPIQTISQILAGIEIPISVLISKVATFVVLAAFATFFNAKLYGNMEE